MKSITDYFSGKVLSTADYTVAYFDRDNSNYAVDDEDGVVPGKFGTAPVVPGNYTLVIYKGKVDTSTLNATSTAASITADAKISVNFTVAPKTVSLEGAFAYENDANDDDNFADTEFKYLGKDVTFGFAVDGEKVDLSKVNVVWTQLPAGLTMPAPSSNEYTIDAADVVAGTYSAKITAKEGAGAVYSGSETVTFEVKPIDLSKDEISIAPVASATGLNFTSVLSQNNASLDKAAQLVSNQILVNGEALASGLTVTVADDSGDDDFNAASMRADLIAYNGVQQYHISATNAKWVGTYTIKVSDSDLNDPNIVGSAKTVDAVVTNGSVSYKYKNAAVDSTPANDIDIALEYGESFNPDLLSATYSTTQSGAKKANFDWRLVDAKGEEVAPADIKQGVYYLYLTTDVFKSEGETFAGYEKVTVNVSGPSYDDAEVFASVDDKLLSKFDGNTYEPFEYTGEAYKVNIFAKNGEDKLVEGEDYTVSVKDDEGNDVESILELGKYVVAVDFADENEISFGIEITKADIESAKATADFFALPADGSAATPTFVGSTNDDFKKGQQFDLSADEISVVYYEVELIDAGKSTEHYAKVANAEALSADDLTEAGTYAAEINVLTTAKNIKSTTTLSAFDHFDAANNNGEGNGVVVENDLVFKVSKAVAFSDVDANAWYAGAVYTAASEDFKYMTGLAGTALFMPMSEITRAQVAQVFFNMAGGDEFDATKVSYDDLVSGAWYGPAVAWASQAGIVTGYAGTNSFGPDDNATREQVATMIYRYMKAQGKDVTVEDEAAALAKYADGASVSDWAKTAMAWCVEQGVFGVDVDTLRPQDNLSRAEMAATSVRVQPEGAYTEL